MLGCASGNESVRSLLRDNGRMSSEGTATTELCVGPISCVESEARRLIRQNKMNKSLCAVEEENNSSFASGSQPGEFFGFSDRQFQCLILALRAPEGSLERYDNHITSSRSACPSGNVRSSKGFFGQRLFYYRFLGRYVGVVRDPSRIVCRFLKNETREALCRVHNA
jgi:hypothetical protein